MTTSTSFKLALSVLLIMNCIPVNRLKHQRNKNTKWIEIQYGQHNKSGFENSYSYSISYSLSNLKFPSKNGTTSISADKNNKNGYLELF